MGVLGSDHEERLPVDVRPLSSSEYTRDRRELRPGGLGLSGTGVAGGGPSANMRRTEDSARAQMSADTARSRRRRRNMLQTCNANL